MTDNSKEFVVNGALCFISSARHSYTEQALHAVCLGFYSSEKVTEARDLLFSLMGETVAYRRGKGKQKAELGDILDLLSKMDEESIPIPKCVADNHKDMPPSSGFEVLSEHMLTFLVEIEDLKEEIKSLKEQRRGHETMAE